MAGKTLDLDHFIVKDQLACAIAEMYVTWKILKNPVIEQWDETRRYVYATDTRTTTNQTLPWKNTTTIPKLCQIRDNLAANYMASLFPKRKWVFWEADNESDEQRDKKDAIEAYMNWVIERPEFRNEMQKLVYDFIDTGNPIATVEWVDNRVFLDDRNQKGFVGPLPRRISPLDIVFNPIAPSFERTPKIVRTLTTLGELKEQTLAESTDMEKEDIEKLFEYLRNVRFTIAAQSTAYDITEKDSYFRMDGYDSFRAYLSSSYCEVLTFYGDLYDIHNDVFYKNHIITVVDRHKIISVKPNPSYFGTAPIYHSGWRIRQDNLWAMGPLDNLIGMQYRIDHLENSKADLMDLTNFPPLKLKGQVDEFTWGPFEKIHVDVDGDVEVMQIASGAYQINLEIDQIMAKMEEMAGAPKEAMGFRSPGEKTAYEVQRLENAASRIFQAKIIQFEEQIVEPILNAMLEIARRKMNETTIRVLNDEFKIASFMNLTPDDITGSGRIRPIAARNFAEKAEKVQNLNNLTNSPLWQDIKMHFSSEKMASMMEELLDLEGYKVVQPYVLISEQAEAARLSNAAEEQVMMETQTPSGLTPDDVSPEVL